jgi:hypothetical protein
MLTRSSLSIPASLTSVALTLLLLTGCAGYRLGSTLSGDIQSVFVPTFANESVEPDLESEATGATILEIQADGTLDIEGENDADTILTVTVTSLTLKPLRYSGDQVTQVSEYRLIIRASFEFTERKTGRVIVKKSVTGRSTFELSGDLTSSKQEAIPDATRNLAHNIVERIVESW